MTPYVLDASVVAALYLDDPLSAAATSLIERLEHEERVLHAPELMLHEVANALWKAARAGRLVTEDCLECISALAASEIELHSARELVPAAMSVALAHGLSAYDAAYLALALKLGGRLATGDRAMALRADAAGVIIEALPAS